MTITEMLAGRTTREADAPAAKRNASANGGDSFDNVMNRAEKTDAKSREPAEPVRQRPMKQRPERQERPEAPKAQTAAADKPQPAQDVQAAQAVTPPDPLPQPDALEDFAQKAADALGVTMEAVMAALQTLNLQPADLAVPENLNAFARAVFAAQTPAELLNVPNIRDMMETVKALAAQVPQEEAGQSIAAFAEQVAAVKPTITPTAAAVTAQTAEAKPVEAQTAVRLTEAAPKAEAAAPEETDDAAKTTAQTQSTEKPQKPAEQGQTHSEQNGKQGEKPPAEAPRAETNPAMARQADTPVEVNRVFTVQEAARAVSTRDVVEQIVSRVRVEVRMDTAEMRLTLKPESLGDVQLKLITQNGVVTAQFMAESQRVKEIIEAGFNQLRDALNEQGLNVAALNVSVGQEQESAEGAGAGQGGGQAGEADVDNDPADDTPKVDAYGQDLSATAVDYTA